MSRKRASRRHIVKGLTPLEERFCAEYVVDFDGTAALKRAGSSAKWLSQQAYEMLRKPHIATRIQELIVGQNEKALVNKQWVMNELVLVYRSAMAGATAGKGNSAERATALRALEKLGQHVDVNAFRAQVGIGNPDGSAFDLSGLSDGELDNLESILSKVALSGGDSSGESPTQH